MGGMLEHGVHTPRMQGEEPIHRADDAFVMSDEDDDKEAAFNIGIDVLTPPLSYALHTSSSLRRILFISLRTSRFTKRPLCHRSDGRCRHGTR